MDSDILELQLKLQRTAFNIDVLNLDEEELIDYITWNAFAMLDEVHEAMKEVSWKPWASATYVNREAFLKELIDAAHFLNNMWLAVAKLESTEAASLFKALYQDKHITNARRQAVGYDGVSGKCPACHRDLDETELITLTDVDGVVLVACKCGQVLVRKPASSEVRADAASSEVGREASSDG